MTFETLLESAPAGTIERLETLKGFRERPDYHPEESAYIHIKIVTNRLIQTGNPDLIVSGILHDICKLETAKINTKNGFPTSPGHESLNQFESNNVGKQALSIGAVLIAAIRGAGRYPRKCTCESIIPRRARYSYYRLSFCLD